MTIQPVRVGGFMEDAAFMYYSYEDTTDKVTTLDYQNLTTGTLFFALFRASDHTLLYTSDIPPNTPHTVRNIPAGQQPSTPGVGNYTPALNMGTAPTASPTHTR